jgi:hypothetical protein
MSIIKKDDDEEEEEEEEEEYRKRVIHTTVSWVVAGEAAFPSYIYFTFYFVGSQHAFMKKKYHQQIVAK